LHRCLGAPYRLGDIDKRGMGSRLDATTVLIVPGGYLR
jgi:hypothetical protein